MSGFDMKDYVPVDERIREFRKQHPEGSLQSVVIRWPEEGFPFIAVEARAYRTPDDPRPGVGLAYENFPGKTNYTRDSELMNAETSAWGRAIVAALSGETKRGPIASRDEVFRAQANQQNSVEGQVRTKPATDWPKAAGAGEDSGATPAANGHSAFARYESAVSALGDDGRPTAMAFAKDNKLGWPPKPEWDEAALIDLASHLEAVASQGTLA